MLLYFYIRLKRGKRNARSRILSMNESYVLVAIILCVWLLVKLLPGMEP